MSAVTAARKNRHSPTQAIHPLLDAAEVQTAGWAFEIDLDRSAMMTSHADVAPASIPGQEKIIIDYSALMAYLRLYRIPDDHAPQEYAAIAALTQQDSTQCVCCGPASSVDEVGFCAACLKAARQTSR